MITRRGFLGSILTAAAAATVGMDLDPDLALWVPGKKAIILPPTTIFQPVAPVIVSPAEAVRDVSQRAIMDATWAGLDLGLSSPQGEVRFAFNKSGSARIYTPKGMSQEQAVKLFYTGRL